MTIPSTSQATNRNKFPVYAKNGWRYDRKVTSMMVEEFIFNPILAAKVLLGLKIPPHMELRISLMWVTYYTCDDSGFSTGKSMTAAIISALRSILFSERISAIISGTFRQGQLVFKNYDDWANNSSIFRSQIRYKQGKLSLSHRSDVWQARFVNNSETRVLPPSFHTNSEKLRSERWHDGYFDEWTIFGNFSALTKTLFGRVTAANSYPDCPIRQNHIHLASTPGFKFSPSYKVVSDIDSEIIAGNKDFVRFTCNYRHIPRRKKWSWLYTIKVIRGMQQTNPPGVVKSEIDGLWQEDSFSYYSSYHIANCRSDSWKMLTRRESAGDIFGCGFDTARGSQSKTTKRGDDFALVVSRVPEGNYDETYPCFALRYNNLNARQMAGLVHKYNALFGFSHIVYDTGGGGIFVRDELRNYAQEIDGADVESTPIVEFGDVTGAIGHNILVPFLRSNVFLQRIWGKSTSDSMPVNYMHKLMSSKIENGSIVLPPQWGGWNLHQNFKDNPDSKRDILDSSPGISLARKAKANADLMVEQLKHVDVERDKNGIPNTDSKGMHKFSSKFKKDLAYGFLYSSIAVSISKNEGVSSGQADDEDFGIAVGPI